MNNRELRSERMSIARSKGRHSKKEWSEMKDFFNHTCVKCYGYSGLPNVERDHIIPIYQGGSDSIANIQPLCARCNSGKGAERIDYRPIAARLMNKKLPDIYL